MDEGYKKGLMRKEKEKRKTGEVPEVLGNIVVFVLALCIILMMLALTSAICWGLYRLATGS